MTPLPRRRQPSFGPLRLRRRSAGGKYFCLSASFATPVRSARKEILNWVSNKNVGWFYYGSERFQQEMTE